MITTSTSQTPSNPDNPFRPGMVVVPKDGDRVEHEVVHCPNTTQITVKPVGSSTHGPECRICDCADFVLAVFRPTRSFMVGDLVRRVGAPGVTGVVRAVQPADPPLYEVLWDDGVPHLHTWDKLEIYHPKRRGFQPGDRVRLLLAPEKVGKILGAAAINPPTYKVAWDDDTRGCLLGRELELAPEPAPAPGPDDTPTVAEPAVPPKVRREVPFHASQMLPLAHNLHKQWLQVFNLHAGARFPGHDPDTKACVEEAVHDIAKALAKLAFRPFDREAWNDVTMSAWHAMESIARLEGTGFGDPKMECPLSEAWEGIVGVQRRRQQEQWDAQEGRESPWCEEDEP